MHIKLFFASSLIQLDVLHLRPLPLPLPRGLLFFVNGFGENRQGTFLLASFNVLMICEFAAFRCSLNLWLVSWLQRAAQSWVTIACSTSTDELILKTRRNLSILSHMSSFTCKKCINKFLVLCHKNQRNSFTNFAKLLSR